MATQNKTQPNAASVQAYLDAPADEERRGDLRALVAMMSRVTGLPPTMWGPGIVGFGKYRYRYASGREDNAPLAAFSSRKPDIAVYLTPGEPSQATLLPRLGKHKMGKACLYLRRLDDVDLTVLEQLVAEAAATTRAHYPA